MAAIERANQQLPDDKKIHTVPMVVAPQGTSIEDMTLDLILSNSGKQLRPYEQAIAIKRLTRYGMESTVIAERLSLSVQHVNGLLTLASAPPAIRDMVLAGQVSATTAIAEMTQHGAKAIERLQQGLEAAIAVGGKKVTGRHLPGNAFKRAVSRSAHHLYVTAKQIKMDPGYNALSKENQQKLEELLNSLEQLESEITQTTSQSEC